MYVVNQTILRLDSYIDAILITHSHLVSPSSSLLISKSVADVIVISHSVIWSVCQFVSQSVTKSVRQSARKPVSQPQSVGQTG